MPVAVGPTTRLCTGENSSNSEVSEYPRHITIPLDRPRLRLEGPAVGSFISISFKQTVGINLCISDTYVDPEKIRDGYKKNGLRAEGLRPDLANSFVVAFKNCPT